MSLEFYYEVFNNSDDDMHEDEGECYENECVCECLSGKFTIHFKTIVGLNQEYYTFESVMTFFMNKLDRKNLKMFIYILKNPEKIYDITEKSKQKIEQIHTNQDRTDLSRNRRLHYNSTCDILTFDFQSSRYNNNSFTFNFKSNEIVFHSKDEQSCPEFCSCAGCENYGKFQTSLNVSIPFKTETKSGIIQAFEEVYDCLEEY